MCFIISKEISPTLQLQQLVNLNIIVIIIQIYKGLIQIINIYNFNVAGVLYIENIISVISLLETENTEFILLENINLYYLQQGDIYIATKHQAEYLLKAVNNGGFKLAIPLGIIIWQRGTAKSIINLIFINKSLYQRLEKYTSKKNEYSFQTISPS